MDPIRKFALWFRTAVEESPAEWNDPTAMTLATSDKNGRVTARMVLLKQFGADGFIFFTNYNSRKGRQLSENPRAALVFFWPYLYRQVRIEGRIERVSFEESDKYFHSRPRLSQIAAVVSPQSEVIPSRQSLISDFSALKRKLGRQEVKLPKNWGGYRLVPDTIEFWHSRKNRLHDRQRFRKTNEGTWKSELLAP